MALGWVEIVAQISDYFYKSHIAANRAIARDAAALPGLQGQAADLARQIAAKQGELNATQAQLLNLATAPVAPEVMASTTHRSDYTRYFVQRFGAASAARHRSQL